MDRSRGSSSIRALSPAWGEGGPKGGHPPAAAHALNLSAVLSPSYCFPGKCSSPRFSTGASSRISDRGGGCPASVGLERHLPLLGGWRNRLLQLCVCVLLSDLLPKSLLKILFRFVPQIAYLSYSSFSICISHSVPLLCNSVTT